MTRQRRAGGALRRCVLRLGPAGRRDWVEAIWAEAAAVPPGLSRLAWRAGGVRLLAREALMRHRIGSATLFAGAAALVAWVAWPGSSATFADSVDRVDLIAVVALLAAFGLAARLAFGPVASGRPARLLRLGAYAVILALVPAKNVVEQILDVPPRGGVDVRLYRLIAHPGFGNSWDSEIVFLVVIGLYASTILWLTSRRAGVAPATLVIGATAGAILGVVWYVAGPLGFGGAVATNPWLPGADAKPFIVLAVISFFAAPVAAAIVADRRFTGAASSPLPRPARLRQVTAAALLTSLTAGLVVIVTCTGTIAALLAAPWLRAAVFRSHPLSGVEGLRFLVQGNPAALSYSHQITAAMDAPPLLVLCILFPLVAFVITGLVHLDLGTAYVPGPPAGPGGPAGPEPEPPPPGGRPLAASTSGRGPSEPEADLGRRAELASAVPAPDPVPAGAPG
jgi:hypothetical protein